MLDGLPWVLLAIVVVGVGGIAAMLLLAVATSALYGLVQAGRAFIAILATALPERWQRWLVAHGYALDLPTASR